MSRKQSLVVVAPAVLVNLFDVPPMVRLPSKMREPTYFEAHGKQWRLNRISRNTWHLSGVPSIGHSRFGTAAEIAEDIGFLFETGTLPRSKKLLY